MVNFNLGVAGRYKIVAVRTTADGETERDLTPWFDNMILNSGLDNLGGNSNVDCLAYCRVGTGTTPPSAGDTLLQAQVASTSTRASDVSTVTTTEPRRGVRTLRYRFPEGSVTGNIGEVGVGPTASGNLTSRSLIKDAAGNPQIVTPLPDETLDIIYEFSLYAPESDVTGTLTLDGTDYNWTLRAVDFDSSSSWKQGIGSPFLMSTSGANFGAVVDAGPIRPVTADGYATLGMSYAHQGAYVPGSYKRVFRISAGLGQGNVSGGIGYLAISGTFGAFQTGWVPRIPKTGANVLYIDIELSWARRP